MVRYIGKKEPKFNEFIFHIKNIEKLTKEYRRIGVFSIPDGGKSSILRKLDSKFSDTEWTVYEDAVIFYDGEELSEPFLYAFIHPNQIGLPEFDIIYMIQYSTDYKESVSGIRFEDGLFRPIGEYMRYSEWHSYGSNDIARGKKVKNLKELRRFI